MKFLLKTAIASTITILLLGLAVWRYTEVDFDSDTSQISIDRQQISDDLNTLNAGADKLNNFLSSTISKLREEL